MDKEKILEAMAHIDPALVEEADRPAARWLEWRRPALIAACLCLILAGTAVAAGIPGIRVSRIFDGEKPAAEFGHDTSYSGYEIVGGMACIPADSLSEEVNRLALEHPRETTFKAFARWEFAEEFIGRNLLDNPLFDEAPNGTRYTDVTETEWGSCLLMVDASAEGLTSVNAITSYRIGRSDGGKGPVELEVCAELCTDLYAKLKEGQPEDEATWRKRYFPDGGEIEQENYVTPDGLEAVIFQIETRPASYAASFSLNGVRFEITASHMDDVYALETLKAALDACTVLSCTE